MALTTDLMAKRQELVNRMMELQATDVGTPKEVSQQFVTGYVDLVIEASKGNLEPRDHYMQAVIPGVKSAKIPWTIVMDSMVRVAMVLVGMFPQHMDWLVEFNADYTRRLIAAWESS